MSKWIWTVLACVAVGAVAFFGGVFVGRFTAPAGGFNRQGAFGAVGGQNGQRPNGAGFAAGTVLKKDAGTLTLKLQDGGSKTVIISPSTQIVKSELVTDSSISVGTTVTAIGTAASDGSITARAVTIGAGIGGMRGLFGRPDGAGAGGQSGQGAQSGGQSGGQSGPQGGSQGGPDGMPVPPPGQ